MVEETVSVSVSIQPEVMQFLRERTHAQSNEQAVADALQAFVLAQEANKLLRRG
jgi:hypothetical protein